MQNNNENIIKQTTRQINDNDEELQASCSFSSHSYVKHSQINRSRMALTTDDNDNQEKEDEDDDDDYVEKNEVESIKKGKYSENEKETEFIQHSAAAAADDNNNNINSNNELRVEVESYELEQVKMASDEQININNNDSNKKKKPLQYKEEKTSNLNSVINNVNNNIDYDQNDNLNTIDAYYNSKRIIRANKTGRGNKSSFNDKQSPRQHQQSDTELPTDYNSSSSSDDGASCIENDRKLAIKCYRNNNNNSVLSNSTIHHDCLKEKVAPSRRIEELTRNKITMMNLMAPERKDNQANLSSSSNLFVINRIDDNDDYYYNNNNDVASVKIEIPKSSPIEDSSSSLQLKNENQAIIDNRRNYQLSLAKKGYENKNNSTSIKCDNLNRKDSSQSVKYENSNNNNNNNNNFSDKRKKVSSNVLNPSGSLSYYWSMIVSFAFLYNFWSLSYRFAFREIDFDTVLLWFPLDYSADFVYILDVYINFHTGYLEDGVLERNIDKIGQHYRDSTLFYLDCFCLLPLDILYLSIGFNSILRCTRLVKIYKFWSFVDRTERHTNYPNVIRTIALVHYIFVIFHWNACLFHMISKNKLIDIENLYKFEPNLCNDILCKYLHAFYWSTMTLSIIGDLPRPRTKGEYVYTIVELMFGLFLFASVLGHVANIVTNVSAARKEFQAKLDAVKTFMRMRRVSDNLQNKVIRWFDYLWISQKSSDEEKSVACLPDRLKAEIAIHVHLDTLKRVDIFQNTEAGFLCELVLRLKPVLFSPGDYVCRKNEVGHEMYIVSKGILEVVTDNGKEVVAILKAGSYFGEISVLNVGLAGNKRTASVRSVGYSDLFCLNKQDLWDVLKNYPNAEARIRARAEERLSKLDKNKSNNNNNKLATTILQNNNNNSSVAISRDNNNNNNNFRRTIQLKQQQLTMNDCCCQVDSLHRPTRMQQQQQQQQHLSNVCPHFVCHNNCPLRLQINGNSCDHDHNHNHHHNNNNQIFKNKFRTNSTLSIGGGGSGGSGGGLACNFLDYKRRKQNNKSGYHYLMNENQTCSCFNATNNNKNHLPILTPPLHVSCQHHLKNVVDLRKANNEEEFGIRGLFDGGTCGSHKSSSQFVSGFLACQASDNNNNNHLRDSSSLNLEEQNCFLNKQTRSRSSILNVEDAFGCENNNQNEIFPIMTMMRKGNNHQREHYFSKDENNTFTNINTTINNNELNKMKTNENHHRSLVSSIEQQLQEVPSCSSASGSTTTASKTIAVVVDGCSPNETTTSTAARKQDQEQRRDHATK